MMVAVAHDGSIAVGVNAARKTGIAAVLSGATVLSGTVAQEGPG